MAALMNHTVLPPETDGRGYLSALRTVLAGHTEVTVSTPDGSLLLPEVVRELLVDAVSALARGQAVTVEPHRTVLTTQEAADLLGITRPTLVRLLEDGKIPFTSPGRHRRVQLADVLAFRERERAQRGRILDEMGQEQNTDPDEPGGGIVPTR